MTLDEGEAFLTRLHDLVNNGASLIKYAQNWSIMAIILLLLGQNGSISHVLWSVHGRRAAVCHEHGVPGSTYGRGVPGHVIVMRQWPLITESGQSQC